MCTNLALFARLYRGAQSTKHKKYYDTLKCGNLLAHRHSVTSPEAPSLCCRVTLFLGSFCKGIKISYNHHVFLSMTLRNSCPHVTWICFFVKIPGRALQKIITWRQTIFVCSNKMFFTKFWCSVILFPIQHFVFIRDHFPFSILGTR